jgi:hypothetical protein
VTWGAPECGGGRFQFWQITGEITLLTEYNPRAVIAAFWYVGRAQNCEWVYIMGLQTDN